MKAIMVGLALGIAFLFPLLANMTVRIWAEPPEYKDYYNYYSAEPKTAEERAVAEKDHRQRQDRYDKEFKAFNVVAFYITFPMGILAMIGAYVLRRRPTLAAGLLFGGIGTIAFGSYSCWESLPGWQRYVSLLFTLAVLATLALLVDRSTHPQPAPA